MKNTIHTSLLSLALLSGCLGGDPGSADTGTSTVTLTAADFEGGARPVIDLTLPSVRWVVDASEGRFDPYAIEVRTERETVTLAQWVAEAWELDEEAVAALGESSVQIEPGSGTTMEDGVGQHHLAATSGRCRCDLICYPEGCYKVCACDCEILPDGGIRCRLSSSAGAGAIGTSPG